MEVGKWSTRPSETSSSVKVHLFYHKSMETMAKKIQELHPKSVQLAETTWKQFPDGFPNVSFDTDSIEQAKNGPTVCFLSNLSQPSAIFEQMCAIYALPKHRVPELRVIVPWFSTGTMERVETFGEVASAKSLARMLSATPPCRTGPVTFTIYDIHQLQEQFYFDDGVLVELKSAIFLLRQLLARSDDRKQIAICFPDDGSYKRLKTYFSDYPLIVCGKERDPLDPMKRTVKVKDGDAAGMHCVMVDDLVQSGGTFIECAKGLKAGGAAKMSCFATHGILPNESWKKFTEGAGKDLIHKFWITDSLPQVASMLDGQGPFEVLSLAPAIGHLLTGEESSA